jgi:hypothetical protein
LVIREVKNTWTKALDDDIGTLINESGVKGDMAEYPILVHNGMVQPSEDTNIFISLYRGDILNVNLKSTIWVKKTDTSDRKLVIM